MLQATTRCAARLCSTGSFCACPWGTNKLFCSNFVMLCSILHSAVMLCRLVCCCMCLICARSRSACCLQLEPQGPASYAKAGGLVPNASFPQGSQVMFL